MVHNRLVFNNENQSVFYCLNSAERSGFMEKRKTYEVESMDDLRQMIEELPDGVILEVSVKQGGDEDEL